MPLARYSRPLQYFLSAIILHFALGATFGLPLVIAAQVTVHAALGKPLEGLDNGSLFFSNIAAIACFAAYLAYQTAREQLKHEGNARPYPPDWDERRRAIYAREDHYCQNCGLGNRKLHAHHIVPLAVGGSNELSNLACLCAECHELIHPHLRSGPG